MNVWWHLRRWWHRPTMWKECVKPEIFLRRPDFRFEDEWPIQLHPNYRWIWHKATRKGQWCRRQLWRELRISVQHHAYGCLHYAYHWSRWQSRLCCRSVARRSRWRTPWGRKWDHMTTDLCEWLETRARRADGQEWP